VLQLYRCDETRPEELCVINLIHRNSGSFVVSSPSFFVGAVYDSTSKWIRSWYGRKRRNQRKALGILAIKTEIGDPVISASNPGTLLDIQLQALPIGPAKEIIPAAAKVTKVADTGSLNTLRPSRSPSAPSRRYTPYTNSKTVITATTSMPSDEVQFHSSNNLQDNLPSAEPLPSDSISNDKVPFSFVSNEGSAMSQLQNHGSNSIYTMSAYPAAPPSFSYPAAYNPANITHEALPSSINLLPGFDMINNNSAQNYNIDDNMPVRIPTPVQYVHTPYGPPINTSFMDMDDSAFVSFVHGSDEVEEESQSLRQAEVIVIDVERASEFPQHLSHSPTDLNINMEHHSSHGHVPFAYLRQEEEETLSHATGKVEKTIGMTLSADDFSAFENPLMAPIHQLQAKSHFTFPSSDTHLTLSRFPATPMCTHAPTLENNQGTTPENPSPPSRSSLHQYKTNISFGHTQPPLSSHQQYLSMHTPALTTKHSIPTDIDDINTELRSSGSDLVSLTLHALATEEDTFTAAIMLVVLSKAGFIWDY
jgi:hypothetical protein